jgi:hypothetical protein
MGDFFGRLCQGKQQREKKSYFFNCVSITAKQSKKISFGHMYLGYYEMIKK